MQALVQEMFFRMREAWRVLRETWKKRGAQTTWTTFNRPYQDSFKMLRDYAERISPARPGTLLERKWIEKIPYFPEGSETFKSKSPDKTIRVMSFNTLSQHLNDRFSYQFVVSASLRGRN